MLHAFQAVPGHPDDEPAPGRFDHDADDERDDDADDERDDDADDEFDEDHDALDDEFEDDDDLDEEFPLGDGVADIAAEVRCPYCGEPVEIALDPGSGAQQHYVEDCQVCCQPWRVSVHYDEEGHASVSVVAEDER